MHSKKPEGYKELLAYQKALAVQDLTFQVAALFPKTKTLIALADQMSRSARSETKNIVEGWKRNTTKEYFDFLGFAIGSNSELMEDAADVATGGYAEITGVKGVMGEMGAIGRPELDKLPFYPLNPLLPLIQQLFLKCKEVNYLLYRLQQSLDVKMDKDHTKSAANKFSSRLRQDEAADKNFEQLLKQHGLTKTAEGFISEDKK